MKYKGFNTTCIHAGEIENDPFKGAVSPLFMSTSYAYENVETKRYPRAFNTPNQEALCKKIAALEHTEAALLFGSGMGAVSTALLAFLQPGDHVVFQKSLYGGTFALTANVFTKMGIQFTMTPGVSKADFENAITDKTKIIFIETPSNPLLTLTDVQMVADLAKDKGLISMIDNTFATPVNQNPHDLGIDVVIHSATKYMGGHSDILAGAVCASNELMATIHSYGMNIGANLSDYTVWLLERSIKTLGIRVKAQNENALVLAEYLEQHESIEKVYYPGLKSHQDYELATKQMRGFGGMMSFELKEGLDSVAFVEALEIIKPSMSLAGIESTILSPAKTSHQAMPREERLKQGISDELLRFSVGIEETEDLIADLENAFKKIK
ncbi:cystathionine beta-lyase [Pustulibacterium marinum]|uniref:Cystathionine beta-lyase n=1 Tax=Pustulibacterium marinum TaxID=1224947 RepID=A0A1I7H7C8_9FLAO|nr:PLP-dependent aspartate aminotransferase family protein [Pustulibacterium marinum]SFU56608.1 cystathionine beta-lyase [Pustulibacterium marinum]